MAFLWAAALWPLCTCTLATPTRTCFHILHDSLVIQSIIPLKNALESNMAKIWIWGMPATGDLKRPFKVPSMFGGLDNNSGPQADKASVKEAEKVTGAIQAKLE